MTEFALALPILALLLFAVIQFGIVFNHYVTLTDATRAGARKAAVGPAARPNSADACRPATQDLGRTNLEASPSRRAARPPGSRAPTSR